MGGERNGLAQLETVLNIPPYFTRKELYGIKNKVQFRIKVVGPCKINIMKVIGKHNATETVMKAGLFNKLTEG